MLKNLEKYSIIKKECKKALDQNIADILLFGSLARGKIDANDIDLCIIFREDINQNIVNRLSHALEGNNINAHISALNIAEFFTKPHSLIRTLLKEGKSIITGKNLADNFGLETFTLYNYNLTLLKKTDRVKFVYLLKGRKKTGIIESNNGIFLAPGCFIAPIKSDHEIKSLFDFWKIKYNRRIILLAR